MTSSVESFAFTVPLTAENRAKAQQFAQQMPYAAKALAVERTLLATIATQYYLELLGFSSDFANSNSWSLIHQWTGEPADLTVNGHRLHCCPISPEQQIISLPAVDEGLGFVVVQLSPDHYDAEVTGFLPLTAAAQATRNQLQPLGTLIRALKITPVERLHRWLENQASAAWDVLENILTPDYQPALAARGFRLRGITEIAEDLYRALGRSMPESEDMLINDLAQIIPQIDNDELRWQAAEMLWNLAPNHPAGPVILAKDTGLSLSGNAIGLQIGLLPKQSDHFLVLARVLPIGELSVLPQGLEFSGQDDQGQPFFTLMSRENDARIQYKFNASLGDGFRLLVTLGNAQIIEAFSI